MSSTLSNISARQLRQAASIKEQIQSLEKQLNQIGASTTGSTAAAAPKRPMSAATRAKLAAAAKARWAKKKAE